MDKPTGWDTKNPFGLLEFENSLGDQTLALRQDTDFRLRDVRWSALIGSVVVSIAFIAAAWPIVPISILLNWWIVHIALIGCMFCVQSGWILKDWRDKYQAPQLLAIIYWFRGVWFGTIPLLNWDAFNQTEYFWITLTFCGCFITGQMVSNSISAIHVLTAVLMMFAGMAFLSQDILIGVGILVSLAITVKGVRRIQKTRINEVRLKTRLKHQAYLDTLTGTLSRSGLESAILNNSKPIRSVLLIDLDRFKEVNDQLGHEAGDYLLRQVAKRIKETAEILESIVARLGGDEFLVVSDSDDLSELTVLAEHIVQALEKPFSLPLGEARISASIGIALNKSDEFDFNKICQEADEAMYQAKSAPIGKVVYFDNALRRKSQKRREIKAKLRDAIQHKEIVPWGQPIIDLKSGRIAGVELLARWPQADGSILGPGAFIPIAEELGLIEDLTLLTLEYAAPCLTRWQTLPHMAETYLTINAVPRDLTEGRLLDKVTALCQQGRLNPARLVIEITEREIIEAEDVVRRYIEQLHQLGVKIAIDDFGTGFSSFHSIVALPIDILKLDRSLIASIADDGRMQAAVVAILQMARQLGIHTVGEGVELAKDASVLQRLGLDLVQGFLYAKPMPLDDIPKAMDWSPYTFELITPSLSQSS
ncbi:MAG: putative bifunctional diguanylate cyclase/phosphodiesterase [Leptolyngbyaceae cyanobacterium]